MSHETRYNLTTPTGHPAVEEIASKLAEICDATPPGHPEHNASTELWADTLEGRETTYWHEIEKEMAELSTNWPGILFTIDCQGQTPDDLWRVYAKDGVYQVVKPALTYPEPSPDGWRKP